MRSRGGCGCPCCGVCTPALEKKERSQRRVVCRLLKSALCASVWRFSPSPQFSLFESPSSLPSVRLSIYMFISLSPCSSLSVFPSLERKKLPQEANKFVSRLFYLFSRRRRLPTTESSVVLVGEEGEERKRERRRGKFVLSFFLPNRLERVVLQETPLTDWSARRHEDSFSTNVTLRARVPALPRDCTPSSREQTRRKFLQTSIFFLLFFSDQGGDTHTQCI